MTDSKHQAVGAVHEVRAALIGAVHAAERHDKRIREMVDMHYTDNTPQPQPTPLKDTT